MRQRIGMLAAIGATWMAGCGAPQARAFTVGEKLALIGLEVSAGAEECVPAEDRARVLPCRVIPGSPARVVPENRAGYAITGVNRSPAASRDQILRALEECSGGRTLYLTLRRNQEPGSPEWYEAEVPLRVP